MRPGKHNASSALGWLIARARSAAPWVGFSVGLGLAGGLALVAQAWFTSRIIHGATVQGSARSELGVEFAAVAVMIGIRAILAWGREAAAFQASAAIRQEVRTSLVAHIHRLGPAYLSGQKSGALSSTVMEQVEGLHGFFAHYLPQLALAVMIPAAVLCVVFPVSWAAGGLLLLTAPLIPLFMMLIGMGAESLSQRHFQALARMSAHFLDTLTGLSTLKLFNRSRGEAASVSRVSESYRRRTMGVLRVAFLSSAVLEFLSSLAIALVAVYLGMSLLGYYHFGAWGEPLTLAGAFLILLLAPEFFLPLRELGTHFHARAEAVGAAGEILKILQAQPPATGTVNPPFRAAAGIRLAFDRVGFSYAGERQGGLDGISFAMESGDTLFLVGESGAGKSTLIHLLLGFMEPTGGEILVNGEPLARFDRESWRRHVAWIGQQPVLFPGSILDNIRMGRPGATDTDVDRAAEAARVWAFARRLPDGLDTRVGERGWGLSRGQAQRIALARAFLKDAPLLLLDEPTAGLDAENERLVHAALLRLTAHRTVLIATHRLSRLNPSDRLVVLSRGAMAARGLFSDLAAAGGALDAFLKEEEGRVDRG